MGMAADNGLECFRDVGGRVDVVELAGGNDRRKQSPIVSPTSCPAKRAFFSGQADWPDCGVLDRVRVELEAPVFEEAGQSLPVIERVADVLGERRTAGDHRQLFLEPRLQRLSDGQRMLLARGQPDVRRCTAHRGFDGFAARVVFLTMPFSGLKRARFVSLRCLRT